MFRLLVVLLFSGLGVQGLQGQSRIECNQLPSRILHETVHFCVMLPSGYDPAKSYPVLYYLHGLGDNEQTLFKSGGWNLLQDMRNQHKITDLLIVSPEGKASFYVNSADKKVLYSDFLLSEFMPYIEQKYATRKDRKSRAVSGVSMGGYGALRLAFAHPELFGSVSAQSAALAPKSASPGDSFGRFLGSVFGNPIDIPHWKQNDPVELAKKNQAGLRRHGNLFQLWPQRRVRIRKWRRSAAQGTAIARHRPRIPPIPRQSRSGIFLAPHWRDNGVSLSCLRERPTINSSRRALAQDRPLDADSVPRAIPGPNGQRFALPFKPHQKQRLVSSGQALLIEPVIISAHVGIHQRAGGIEFHAITAYRRAVRS